MKSTYIWLILITVAQYASHLQSEKVGTNFLSKQTMKKLPDCRTWMFYFKWMGAPLDCIRNYPGRLSIVF